MIAAILILVLAAGVSALWYWIGYMDGKQHEYKKWYARQWHRPGCSCDISNRRS